MHDSPSPQKTTEAMDVIVIGAGPAGLTAAVQLARQGLKVTLLEAGQYVGGMCVSLPLWGQTVDLGPHRFFSKNDRVNDFWLSIGQNHVKKVTRLTRIFYKNKFFSYPLKPFEAFLQLGPVESIACVLSYFKEQVKLRTPLLNSFEKWVTHHFGKRLFQIFFKSYSEKLWGIPCDQLDADFAAQRIKKFSLGHAISRAFIKPKRTPKTLVSEFYYPTGGTGMIYSNIAQELQKLGGKLVFGAAVSAIETEHGQLRSVKCSNGTTYYANHFISTMPLTHLVKGFGHIPSEVNAALQLLKYRNTILVYLELDTASCFPDQWIYVHSEEVGFGRITNFRNWVPELYGEKLTSIICLEYWCQPEDEIWNLDDNGIAQRAKIDLLKIDLFRNVGVLNSHVHKISRSYPIYQIGYQSHVEVIRKFLVRYNNLQVIGRYGSFKYNNQDHSIYMGLLAADNLTKSVRHDLWSVNTDYDSYQEA